MKYTLFLGCTIPGRVLHYELATRKVAEKLGIEFVDIDIFSCCGFPLRSVDQEAALAMTAQNIALAEKEGHDICTLCASCTSVLTEANEELKHDQALRERINAKLQSQGLEFKGTVEVKHFARVLLEDVGAEEIKKHITKDLGMLKVAPHYGCHYTKPAHIYGRKDDPENPQTLDQLVRLTGAQSLDYQDKLNCCGGAVLAFDQDVAMSIANKKLKILKEAGADLITLVCPFCNVMYDDNQRNIEQKFETTYKIPVFFYPQLLGLAMGIDVKSLGLKMNRVKAKELLARLEEKAAS